jgi:hypothetical protein
LKYKLCLRGQYQTPLIFLQVPWRILIYINFKSVDKNIEALRKDIRIIESGISKATWSIEIWV